jgi:uncharacterized repeat protein (TIGR03833 family)
MEVINQHHHRDNIKPGLNVLIVQKQDQRSGKLTSGVVDRLLTSKGTHTRGIKVKLTNGKVGRVQQIVTPIKKPIKGDRFIIHEHHADRVGLHYDIRLERKGILKSFACRYYPDLIKGTKKKILIIGQSDHQLDWFDFEGEISDGYGKGKVQIWDKGSYETIKWEEYSQTVVFNGEKSKGEFHIIPYNIRKKQYLMFRSKDKDQL